MGMDGFSIANTGIIKEQTSAEYSSKVEQAIASDPKNSPQQVHGLNNNQIIKSKEDGEENGGGKQQFQGFNRQEEFQDGLVEEDESTDSQDFDVEDFENPDKDFYVKLNVKDDIIELYDSSTDRIIETISGTELGELVKKLNMASGIFVNKKV